jgi:IS1 family transposase
VRAAAVEDPVRLPAVPKLLGLLESLRAKSSALRPTSRSTSRSARPPERSRTWSASAHALRQRLARYVRKTLSFSKSDRTHHVITKWFITCYSTELSLNF